MKNSATFGIICEEGKKMKFGGEEELNVFRTLITHIVSYLQYYCFHFSISTSTFRLDLFSYQARLTPLSLCWVHESFGFCAENGKGLYLSNQLISFPGVLPAFGYWRDVQTINVKISISNADGKTENNLGATCAKLSSR